MPDKPNMGGLTQVGKEDWAPWTGGKPKADWTGLEEPDPTYIDPSQYRPVSAGSAQKSKKYRVEALKEKLSKGGNLLDFQKKFSKKMGQFGLDTITYLPDPSDAAVTSTTKAFSVVNHHSRFTESRVDELSKEYEKRFDKYDRSNCWST